MQALSKTLMPNSSKDGIDIHGYQWIRVSSPQLTQIWFDLVERFDEFFGLVLLCLSFLAHFPEFFRLLISDFVRNS